MPAVIDFLLNLPNILTLSGATDTPNNWQIFYIWAFASRDSPSSNAPSSSKESLAPWLSFYALSGGNMPVMGQTDGGT